MGLLLTVKQGRIQDFTTRGGGDVGLYIRQSKAHGTMGGGGGGGGGVGSGVTVGGGWGFIPYIYFLFHIYLPVNFQARRRLSW